MGKRPRSGIKEKVVVGAPTTAAVVEVEEQSAEMINTS
jgi:hypothetical protein